MVLAQASRDGLTASPVGVRPGRVRAPSQGTPPHQPIIAGVQRLDDITDIYRILRYPTEHHGVQQTYG
jgi:hypothetical protein